MRGASQDGRTTWIASCQKALHTQFNLCLTFLVKYVFMFRNGFGTAQSKGVQLATALLYSICVSVEARVASKDFVNFVIGKP